MNWTRRTSDGIDPVPNQVGDVFEDIGFTPAEAAELAAKATLKMALKSAMRTAFGLDVRITLKPSPRSRRRGRLSVVKAA